MVILVEIRFSKLPKFFEQVCVDLRHCIPNYNFANSSISRLAVVGLQSFVSHLVNIPYIMINNSGGVETKPDDY